MNDHIKNSLVDAILDNDTYLPESGLRLQVRQSLLKLSRTALEQLKLIVDLKVAAASRDALEEVRGARLARLADRTHG